MAPPVASPESPGPCPPAGALFPFFLNIAFCVFSLLLTIIGAVIAACAYMVKPNGLHLVVMGGSFQMNESLQGNNMTIRFTLRAENPTGDNTAYKNISATLAVLNEYREKGDHFVRFPVTDFNVQQGTFVDSPTQVTATATQLSIGKKSIAVVLQLNGTMETSSRNSSAGYRCRIWTSKDDKACSRVKQHLV